MILSVDSREPSVDFTTSFVSEFLHPVYLVPTVWRVSAVATWITIQRKGMLVTFSRIFVKFGQIQRQLERKNRRKVNETKNFYTERKIVVRISKSKIEEIEIQSECTGLKFETRSLCNQLQTQRIRRDLTRNWKGVRPRPLIRFPSWIFKSVRSQGCVPLPPVAGPRFFLLNWKNMSVGNKRTHMFALNRPR